MLFNKEKELLRKAVRDFVSRELATLPEEIDKTGEMPRELLDKMAKTKYTSVTVPEEYGGAGSDYVSYAIIMEELSRRCASTGTYATAASSLVSLPILNYGTEEQKQKYLRGIASGEMIGAFGLTEPGAGSDASAQQTTAELDGDYYILNGRKTFITNAPICDVAIVIAVTDRSKGLKGTSAFIVESKWEGFSHGAHEDKMGIRGTQTSDLIFENVKVPKENLLGKEGIGFKIAMNTLDAGRIGVAAQALGIAQGALDEAIKYTKERVQFGRTLSKFQNTQFTLADMETKVNAARWLVYDAAEKKDAGVNMTKESAMAKYYAAEIANEVAYKALQLHGGYGFIKDYPIERIYRDARIMSIYEGTSEVQKMVISSSILK
ncbi:MAG: acyl-CoA dehydrogenase family protein [Paraclostridium bifermentans]|uniref:Acyl-CoA dehydrogenase, N-terminal domain protein n=1 Tax=Paraclostridium bifermentans ATCC 638 = DSM 14991 TaxID=1233171 RepID=T4VIR0_PARBF|nr:putative isocaproyl-CoA dehydrogenase AcdB [Paraclostridium bifermentans]EQK41388.1 acyl-CoA dehydrogenase, N-terminal domain protein [[Clostridium] bifermentans ATCC 638] [Paraclostridium bifermentans ATCC 638 = DSM 14991]MBS5953692.1 acyl-CoA dehydrogenase family protein [Paraclostridium bifermentans]MBS6507082.1 acyl-CoA dehydrogenase family protein [Paraclostridium bifermentans]MBU5288593.1 acyl-CoA dehydrogenase family protein [Paraclostridium bifermentans]MDU3802314.1 putative isocapr